MLVMPNDWTLRFGGHTDNLPEATTNPDHATDIITVQLHQVETKGVACLGSCALLFQRYDDDEDLQATPPHTPPSADISTPCANRTA